MSTGSTEDTFTFGGDFSQVREGFSEIRREFTDWTRQVSAVGVGTFLAENVLGGLRLIREGFRDLISEARDWVAAAAEAETVDHRLALAVKNAGANISFTTDQLREMADALKDQTAFGDESIKQAETSLVRYRLLGDVFERTLRVSLDLAEATGQDLTSSAEMLGRALANPLRGMLLLTRQGIVLTEEQRKLIKSSMELGDIAKAQGVILGVLEERYKGAAAAALETGGGAWRQIQEIFGDITEELGMGLLPVLKEFAPVIRDVAREFLGIAEDFAEWGKQLAETADEWLPQAEQRIRKFADSVVDIFSNMRERTERAWLEILNATSPAEGSFLDKVRNAFGQDPFDITQEQRDRLQQLRLNELNRIIEQSKQNRQVSGLPSGFAFGQLTDVALRATQQDQQRQMMEIMRMAFPTGGRTTQRNFFGDQGPFMAGGQMPFAINPMGLLGFAAMHQMRPREEDRGFQSAIEDAHSMFRRMQTAAASIPEKENKQLTLMDKIREHNEKTAEEAAQHTLLLRQLLEKPGGLLG